MHTPSTIKQEFENGVRKYVNLETVVEITGIYHAQKGDYYNFKKLGIIYYDRLEDQESNEVVVLLVPKNKRAVLKSGKSYKLRCLIDYKDKGECSVELQLTLMKILGSVSAVDHRGQKDLLKKTEILCEFNDKKKENLSVILKKQLKSSQLPCIALVQGKNNKTLNDIIVALGEHGNKYSFEECSVNIHNEQEIIDKLNEINNSGNINLIALFRGGGGEKELSIFDSSNIAETVIKLKIPFVCAIGHAEDEPFVQRISTRSFDTPTNFGYYLKETYINSGKEDDLTNRENSIIKAESEFYSITALKQQKLDAQNSELEERERKLNIKIPQVQSIEKSLKEKSRNLDERELGLENESIKIDEKHQKNFTVVLSAALTVGLLFGSLSYFILRYFFG